MLIAPFAVLLIGCIFLPLVIAAFAFWVWMLISACQNKGLSDGEKVAWVLVIALVHLLGAIIYFFVGHPKRNLPPLTA